MSDNREALIIALREKLIEIDGGNAKDDTWWANDHASDLADAVLAAFPILTKSPSIAYWDKSNPLIHYLTSKDKATHVSQTWYLNEPIKEPA